MPPQQSEEQQPPNINGDESYEFGGDVINAVPIEAGPPSHREKTASRIAMALLVIFASAMAIHYVSVLSLIWGDKESAIDVINRQFTTWLPVLSGLVGSAATYYFTKDK
jgi:hypothetical protein